MNESSKFYQTDFQDLSADEMEAMIVEKKSTLRSLDSEKRDLQTERKYLKIMKDNKMQITKNESLSKVDEMFCELKNKKN